MSPSYLRVKLLKDGDGRVIEVVKSAVRPLWECDGDSDRDRAYPFCTHCEGDGYRTVEPGCYAVYERYEPEEENDDDD